MQLRTSCCVLAGLMLQSLSAQAANLVQNPDFDSGLAVWTNPNGYPTFALDDTTGDPQAPSARISSNRSTVVQVFSNCMSPGSASSFDFFIDFRVNGGFCQAIVQTFADSTCGGTPASPTPFVTAYFGPWTTYSRTGFAVPSGTLGINILVQDNLGADCNFDHVLLGPAGTVDTLFADGFELP